MESILIQNEQIILDLPAIEGENINILDPYSLTEDTFDIRTDIYNLGVVLLKSFAKFPASLTPRHIPSKDVPIICADDFIVADTNLNQLLLQCLCKNPKQRPSATEVLNNQFFSANLSTETTQYQFEQAANRIDSFIRFVNAKRLEPNNHNDQ